MPHLYENLVQAVQAHWKAHANAYPQKFVLSPAQHATLDKDRKAIRRAVTGQQLRDGEPFMGVPLQVSTDSAGEMVAIDGTVSSLESYTRAGAVKG
ncbi:DNA helicase [Acidovorax phage AP1]|nr:DNA helicase [Acidovorax phage AP1]